MPSGKTSFNKGHTHDYTITTTGNGSTSVNNGHEHKITLFKVSRVNDHIHTIPTTDSMHKKKKK